MSLSRNDIAAVLGPVDDDLAAEIASLNPTREELVQAFAWVHADEALVNEGRPLPSGKVAELIELLSEPVIGDEEP